MRLVEYLLHSEDFKGRRWSVPDQEGFNTNCYNSTHPDTEFYDLWLSRINFYGIVLFDIASHDPEESYIDLYDSNIQFHDLPLPSLHSSSDIESLDFLRI